MSRKRHSSERDDFADPSLSPHELTPPPSKRGRVDTPGFDNPMYYTKSNFLTLSHSATTPQDANAASWQCPNCCSPNEFALEQCQTCQEPKPAPGAQGLYLTF